MKQHLKRLATPSTWNIARKEETFIMRPNPGSQKLRLTLPLGVVLRMGHIALTLKEIKYVLSQGKVFVDGKIQKDNKFGVGFLSTISIPDAAASFRLSLSTKGTLSLVTIPAAESGLKLAKVTDIRKHKKGYALFLSDGRTVVTPKKAATTSSSVLLGVPGQEIKGVFPLSAGHIVFMIAGKHPGMSGIIKNIQGNILFVQTNDAAFSVNKESVIIVGKDKPEITLN